MREIPGDIAETEFDAIVIGAGINGAGVARDAAMRGLRVLVLEKEDVSSGTSAWSTRLIHGGLRYLEHGEVGLVRESLRERERLFRIAPHLVRPLPMLIPLYADGRRKPLVVRAGMIAYDLLSFDKSLARHRMLTPAETLLRAPGLRREGLRGAALYYDAQVEFAERLVLENALSARAHGATFLTYARVERLSIEKGRVCGVEFGDALGGGKYRAHARVVLNVAGPWVDEVLRGGSNGGAASASPPLRKLIGGTKGSHLVVGEFACAPRVALYTEAREDGRPFFIIPWNGRFLIGTTDTRFDGDLDAVETDEHEIAYLLRETNRVLPRAGLTREAILQTYSGVRPLARRASGAEASVTRRHFIREHDGALDGLVSIVGGKLTTYRNLSEQAVDLLFKRLERRSPPCATAREPLPGAATVGGEDFKSFCARFKAESPLHAHASERLLRIYGTRAADVLATARDESALLAPLSEATGAIGAEIIFSFRQEMAGTLTDCLWRRTMSGLSSASAGFAEAEAAARIAQQHLGWDAPRAAREVADYRSYAAKRMSKGKGEKGEMVKG
ncbi:MAG TPA: glycerol-3-phosphate dehydrogenase [Pyrinomonadaceae bacterium]|nr:glycerol-3-phosphate dehydrogenase [Pyrinomonadaceae bacterium]